MIFALLACRSTPIDPPPVFPYVYTPQTELEAYEEVRWETETWQVSDPTMTGLYLQKAFYHRPSAPIESLTHFEAMRPTLPPLAQGIQLAFVGDIMHIDQDNWSEYATPAAPLLGHADLRVGNLETPVSVDHSTIPRELGTYAFNAPPTMLDGLPLDVLQLNNNHSLDAGDLGLENTVQEVLSRGFTPVGVDGQAQVTVDDLEVALLSYSWGINDQRRSEVGHELHLIPFGHIGEPISLDLATAQIAEARESADLVVLLLHWGFEYEYYPDPHFLVLARELIAAGADLIVGQGPHVVQPPEICAVNRGVPEGIGICSIETGGAPRTAAVLYSLGNFGTDMPTLQAQVGLVATVSMDTSGVTGMGWEAVVSVADGPWVRALEPLRSDPDLDAEALRLEAHLGRSWRR